MNLAVLDMSSLESSGGEGEEGEDIQILLTNPYDYVRGHGETFQKFEQGSNTCQ